MGQCFFGTFEEAVEFAASITENVATVISGPFDDEPLCDAWCTATGTGTGTSGIPPTLPPGACGKCALPADLFIQPPLAPISDGDCLDCEDLVSTIQLRQIPSNFGPGTCQWVNIGSYVLTCTPFLHHFTLIFVENGADDFWILGLIDGDYTSHFTPLYYIRDADFVCGGKTRMTLINESDHCAWPFGWDVWH